MLFTGKTRLIVSIELFQTLEHFIITSEHIWSKKLETFNVLNA
jgi:hypothetical protein